MPDPQMGEHFATATCRRPTNVQVHMRQTRWQTTAALGAVMTAGVAFGGIALASTHPTPGRHCLRDPRPVTPRSFTSQSC